MATSVEAKRRIWGWFFFDWASQPYNTLLLTFIFAPYIKETLGDGSAAQAAWGYGVGAAGICIALLAPFLGTIADRGGNRIPWIWAFSLLYVLGAASTWLAMPNDPNLILTLTLFALGLIGMEFATIFTNAMLPSLGTKEEIGRISGSGWAFGYVGGLIALITVLFFFAESGDTGRTLIGQLPAFGLDPDQREGTRFVGPLTAIWYALFMIPFFLWVREPRHTQALPLRTAVASAWPELKATLKRLPETPSLFSFLASSMFYRDALNGLYVFGGLYAAGVLDWSVTDTGIFGIIAVVCSAFAAWAGGRADRHFGPKKIILSCLILLTVVAIAITGISRESVFGISVAADSRLPDTTFYVLGALLGAGGGVLQAASRTMMCFQASEDRATQAFGLYALAGKATSFVAPLSIGVVTSLTGSQQLGFIPLIGLFLLGLILLAWVKPDGDRAA